jgi:Ca2+-binding RTX toxin-like protein
METAMSATSGNDSLLGTSSFDTIAGLDGNDTIRGFAGHDSLVGGYGDDSLDGGTNNDTLAGGDGADTLSGGLGQDFASYAADTSGWGVNASLLLGRTMDWTGEAAGDVFFGIEGLIGTNVADSVLGALDDNTLWGGDGQDTLRGLAGNDLLRGDGGLDSLDGGDDDDYLLGGDGDDRLEGGRGNDYLQGEGGLDTLSGGEGDDTLVADNVGGNLFIGGDGRDAVTYFNPLDLPVIGVGLSLTDGGLSGRALDDRYVGVEDVVTTAFADTVIGNTLDNAMILGLGADIAFGMAGSDTLWGGGGNDSLSGGAGDDYLSGGLGSGVVGVMGADTLAGGAGNDTYLVEESAARLVELRNGGIDTVRTALDWTLGANIENLVLTGPNAVANGNGLANHVTGTAGIDLLTGWGGADTLLGGFGADTLRGGTGDDLLSGGQGSDRLEGGNGFDAIVSDFTLAEVALLRLGNGAIRMSDVTGVDTLISIEALDLGGTRWLVAPSVISFAGGGWGSRATRFEGFAGAVGSAVAGLGDVDGDGLDDLMIGAPGASSGDGKAWLVWGREGGYGLTWLLKDSNATGLPGTFAGGAGAGSAVAGVGDVDGDGHADFAVGQPGLNSGAGGVSLGRGGARDTVGSITDGTSNTVLVGSGGFGTLGNVVAGAGDLNGDGFADFAIAEPSGTGRVSIVFGTDAGWPATESLSDAASVRLVTGSFLAFAGSALAGGGDMNADGFDDLVIGAPGMSSSQGAAWIRFGAATWTPGDQLLGGAGYTRLDGTAVGDQFGSAAAMIGDINGDGFADAVIGAKGMNGGAGAIFIVLGRASFGATTALTAPGIIRIDGVEAGANAGGALAAAGDVNGDGYDDVLIGRGAGGGDAWLLLGRASFAAGTTLNSPGVIRFEGDGTFGRSVAGAGDVDGDGLDDLLIGQSDWGGGAGASWLIHGEHWLGI